MTEMFAQETALRTEIVEVGKLLYNRSLIVARDGNISARLDENHILITPAGLCKARLTPEQMIVLDLAGNRVDMPTEANRHLRSTSETAMHLEVYRQRPDVGAVVHAHPPYAIALSIAGISLAGYMLPEAVVGLGPVKTTPYSTPSSQENAVAIREAIKSHNAIVLQRHGTLTVSDSPLDAFFRTETIEHLSRILFLLHQLGGGDQLLPEQVQKLLGQRTTLGYTLPGEAEAFADWCAAAENKLSGFA